MNYFGARYLDPMIGMWTSVDPARQFSSPYLYAGNGYNPIVSIDEDGNVVIDASIEVGLWLGLGGSFKFGPVINTDNPFDSGIIFGGSVGAGISAEVNTPFFADALAKTANSLVSGAKSSHDLEGAQWNASAGFAVGAKVQLGMNPLGDGLQEITIGEFGGHAAYEVTNVFTFNDLKKGLLGENDGRTLLPTSGPSPADNSNVAVPKDFE